MGAIAGSLTMKRYFVKGPTNTAFKDEYFKGVQKQAFREIDIHSDELLRKVGWVSVDDLLDNTFDDVSKILYNQYICLTMRIDTLAIPPKVFQAHFEQQEKKYLKENPKLKKLPKAVREELKDSLRKKLLAGAIPNSAGYDMVWNLNTHRLYFWSLSKKALEDFEDLFKKSFNFFLIPDHPLVYQVRTKLKPEQLPGIESLKPTHFFFPSEYGTESDEEDGTETQAC
jgi:DNA recombination-dependent growth factor C